MTIDEPSAADRRTTLKREKELLCGKFHRKGAFFVCKRGEICYNVTMKKDNRQPQGFIYSLIGEPTPAKRAGLLYSLLAFAFFGASFLLSLFGVEGMPQWYIYAAFLAAPAAFLVVEGWYFSKREGGIKGFFKEENCSPKYYLLALTMQLGLFPLGELNDVFLQFLEKFGYQGGDITLPSTKGFGLAGVLFVVALLPAFFEELFFRGILQRELKDFSLLAQVLLCGGLFALYHQNPAQTLYQFACGAAFALVAVKAGSFLPTVLSHFVNNALIVLLYAFGIEEYPRPVYIHLLVVGGVALFGTLCYLLIFDKKKKTEKKGSYKQLFACGAVGIFVFGLTWVLTLIMGL